MEENEENKRLRKYAEEMGYNILEEETREMKESMRRMQESISNSTITIRLPNELKQKLKDKAAKIGIPYQRYIKSVLIDSLS